MIYLYKIPHQIWSSVKREGEKCYCMIFLAQYHSFTIHFCLSLQNWHINLCHATTIRNVKGQAVLQKMSHTGGMPWCREVEVRLIGDHALAVVPPISLWVERRTPGNRIIIFISFSCIFLHPWDTYNIQLITVDNAQRPNSVAKCGARQRTVEENINSM